MSLNLDDLIEHHGVKGMKWGVRKEYEPVGRKAKNVKDTINKSANKVSTAFATSKTVGVIANTLRIREQQHRLRRVLNKVSDDDKAVYNMIDSFIKQTGVLPTDESILKKIENIGISKHKDAKYDNIDDKDIDRFTRYTDTAVYSRTINSYLASGSPPNVAKKAAELKESIGKNKVTDQTVYRSCSLNFSTTGLSKKLNTMGEQEMIDTVEKLNKNFKGKTMKENRVYSTSTSPLFAIDTWRKVNPTAAKTYNAYLIINTKNTPGVYADGRTSKNKSLVNTRANQEVILAPNKMTYRNITYDESRQMFAIYMDSE